MKAENNMEGTVLNRIINWITDPEEVIDDNMAAESSLIIGKELDTSILSEIMITKPTSYKDVIVNSDILKDNKVLIIDLNNITENRQRFLDFLSGVALSKETNIRKISENIIMCSPSGVCIKECD